MSKLTAVVLTKNEEKNLEECLSTLKFADEILVVDDESSDRTLEIAEKHNAKIIKGKLRSFSEQRNLALGKASNEWVLFLDADESIDKNLQQEIEKEIKSNKCDGYYIKRNDLFLGKEMKFGDLNDVWLLRLGKKDKGEWEGKVHEIWIVKGRISKLKNHLQHKPHKEISTFVEKLNRYSTIRASELKEKGYKSSLFAIIFYPLGKFMRLYILKLGFRDGIYGFVHAVFMSMYSFLVRSKLFLLIKNEK